MKTYYLFTTLQPIESDKPIRSCMARNEQHAREKFLAFLGELPAQHTIISAEQFRDDNKFIREILRGY